MRWWVDLLSVGKEFTGGRMEEMVAWLGIRRIEREGGEMDFREEKEYFKGNL